MSEEVLTKLERIDTKVLDNSNSQTIENNSVPENNQTMETPNIQNKEKSRQRVSNFEVVRIIAMIMIVIHHFIYHGGFLSVETAPEKYVLSILCTLGKSGIIIFVLMTGYFFCQSRIRFKRLVFIYLQMVFYSVSLYFIISICLKKEPFNIVEFEKVFRPITFRQYWYVATYIALMIVVPILNVVITNCSEKFLRTICIVGFILMLYQVIISKGNNTNFLSEYIFFIYLYFVGAYIKKYYKLKLLGNTIMLCICLGLVVAFNIIAIENGDIKERTNMFYGFYNPLTVLSSIAIMGITKNSKSFYSKIVNIISSSTLGIYLIHDNNWLRGILWGDILQCSSFYNKGLWTILLYMLGTLIIIFTFCGFIDLIRLYFIEKPVDFCYEKAKKLILNIKNRKKPKENS